jgi:hypothetical protein
MSLIIFLCIVVFLIGLYFYAKGFDKEGFTANTSRCPDLLIQKGSRFYLHNSKLAKVPGVNPIEFENLEDYTEFLDWQRSQNIRCPVLYLQESYDTQGKRVYKARPSVSEPQMGLPPSAAAPIGIASQTQPSIMDTAPRDQQLFPQQNPTLLVDATRNDGNYNTNSYPGYDQSSYYIGTTTPLDTMNYKEQSKQISPNPMDTNWGGSKYTQSLVDKGYYYKNEVNIPP